MQKIKDDIENGESVSVVACADGSICLLFYDNKEHRVCAIVADDANGTTIESTFVAPLSIGAAETFDRKDVMKASFASFYGLALPMKSNENSKYLYYVITDSWEERLWDKETNESSFVLPRVDGCAY